MKIGSFVLLGRDRSVGPLETCQKCGRAPTPALTSVATRDDTALLAAFRDMAESLELPANATPTAVTPAAVRTFCADLVDAKHKSVAASAKRCVEDRLGLLRQSLAVGDSVSATAHLDRLLELLASGAGIDLR